MGPEGIILVNPPITTLQQSLTHSALIIIMVVMIIMIVMMVILMIMMTKNIHISLVLSNNVPTL